MIDASQYLLQVSRYIHRNPVEIIKPMVVALEDYRLNYTPSVLGDKQFKQEVQK